MNRWLSPGFWAVVAVTFGDGQVVLGAEAEPGIEAGQGADGCFGQGGSRFRLELVCDTPLVRW